MRGLKDKVGIVAGGGRGIGAATARRLAEEGAHVVIGDLMGDWAREVADDILSKGGKAVGVDLDGTNADLQAAIVAAAVESFGGLDFYHSNLAGGTEGDIDALNCPVEVLDKSFAISTKSHFLATQAALPKLIERGGGSTDLHLIRCGGGWCGMAGGLPHDQKRYSRTRTARRQSLGEARRPGERYLSGTGSDRSGEATSDRRICRARHQRRSAYAPWQTGRYCCGCYLPRIVGWRMGERAGLACKWRHPSA